MTTTSTCRRSSSDAAVDSALNLSVGTLRVACSTRRHGDFHRTAVAGDELEARRRSFVDLPWAMLDQRHGTDVVHVAAAGRGDGAIGDIAFTEIDDVVLGCWVADCAPVLLVGADREFALVHAGWRGLARGVLDRAVAAFSEPVTVAIVGPTIGPCCYEFGSDDLADVAAGVHTTPARVEHGGLALDMRAAVGAGCAHHDIPMRTLGGCTGCEFPGFSHRVRRDAQRHVMAVWRPS